MLNILIAIILGRIGAAIEVHRHFGPGLLESVYRRCLAYELRKKGFEMIEEKPVPFDYDDLLDPCAFRADLLVNGNFNAERRRRGESRREG